MYSDEFIHQAVKRSLNIMERLKQLLNVSDVRMVEEHFCEIVRKKIVKMNIEFKALDRINDQQKFDKMYNDIMFLLSILELTQDSINSSMIIPNDIKEENNKNGLSNGNFK